MNFLRIMRPIMLFLFLLTGFSLAQITILESDIDNLFGANHQVYFLTDTTDTTFQIDIGAPGASQVYDFTGIDFVVIDIGSTFPGTQVPQFASRFPADALVLKQTVDISENYFFP